MSNIQIKDGNTNTYPKSTELVSSMGRASSFASATSTFSPDGTEPSAMVYQVSYTGSDSNAPDTSSNTWIWNVWDYGTSTRRTQVAVCPFRNRDIIYIRQKHDSTWHGWYKITSEPSYRVIPITINTAANASGSGTVYVYGRVATVTASIKYPASGTNLSLGWIQSRDTTNADVPPASDMWLSCDYYSSSGKQCEVKITSGGNLVFNTTEGNVDMKVSGSWIIKG